MNDPQAQLAALAAELKQHQTQPHAEGLAFLAEAQKKLRWIPLSVDARTRTECLLTIAQLYIVDGRSMFSAVEPAALAVMLARDLNDPALLRRALTFQGNVLRETNNPGDSVRVLTEALDLSEQLADEVGRCTVWNSLGNAFAAAAMYIDAAASFERAAAAGAGNTVLRASRSVALQNWALCCLHTNQVDEGLATMHQAMSLMGAATAPAAALNRVLAEGTLTRLLLARDRVDEAAERAQIAREFAEQAKTVRADISASCSEGLVEIYRGLHDQGLTRGLAALEKARQVKPQLRETLLALIHGYEKAGRADKALSLHRELTMHIRRAQHDSIVRHQEAHIRRLELGLEDVFPEAVLSDKDKELQLKLAAQTAGLKQGDLLEQMAFTAEMRDDPSGEHVYRVAKLARLLAEAHGQEPAWCEDLELAARLHDIGKVAIPDTVMKKTTPLTDGERAIVQTHTSTGADLLAKSKMSYAELAEDVARHHHERWDGGGYPEGISGTAIPLGARIVALADVYDALTHEKTYRAAWSSDQALAEIEKNTETQFDPALAGLFVPLVRELLAQYGDHAALDAWLGAAAKDSAISQARARIAASLAAGGAAVPPITAKQRKLVV